MRVSILRDRVFLPVVYEEYVETIFDSPKKDSNRNGDSACTDFVDVIFPQADELW